MMTDGYTWLWTPSGSASYFRKSLPDDQLHSPMRVTADDVAAQFSTTNRGLLVCRLQFGRRSFSPSLATVPAWLGRIDEDFARLNRIVHGEDVSDVAHIDWTRMPFSPWFGLAGHAEALSAAAQTLSPETLGFLGLTPFHATGLSISCAEIAVACGIRASDSHRLGRSGWAALVSVSNWSVLEWLLDETGDSVPPDAVTYGAQRGIPSTILARMIDRASGVPTEVAAKSLEGNVRRAVVRRLGAAGRSPLERALLAGATLQELRSEPFLLRAVAHVQPDRLHELPEEMRKATGDLDPSPVLADILGWERVKTLADEGVIRPIDGATRLSVARQLCRNGDTPALTQLLSEGGFDFGALIESYPRTPAVMRVCLAAARGEATRTPNRLSYLYQWLEVIDVDDLELRAELVAGVDLDFSPVVWAKMPAWFVRDTLARFNDTQRPARIGTWLGTLISSVEFSGFRPRDQQAFDAVFQRWPTPPEGSVMAACQKPCIPTAWTRVLLGLGVDSEQVETRWNPDENTDVVFNISALGMACYYARTENAAMLLRAGADPERPVEEGRSAMQLASQYPIAKRTLEAAQQLVRGEA